MQWINMICFKRLWEYHLGNEFSTWVWENILDVRILKSMSVKIKENCNTLIWIWILLQ